MRLMATLAVAMTVTALTASAALACEGSRTSADSGTITIATGPKPVTPQTPILVPPAD